MPEPTTRSPGEDPVESLEIISVHNTSEGTIAYVRGADGHIAIVDYSVLNPWDWRHRGRRPSTQAA